MTIELPLTAAQRRAIGAEAARQTRLMIMLGGGIIAFFVLIGILVTADSEPAENALGAAGVWIVLGVMSLVIAAIFGGVAVWQRRKASRDLAETSYLRTTGPVSVGGKEITGTADEEETTTATVNTLQLFDRSLPLSAGQAGDLSKRLANVPWGTVDYAEHLQVIFEIRDAEGRSVYRHPKYERGG